MHPQNHTFPTNTHTGQRNTHKILATVIMKSVAEIIYEAIQCYHKNYVLWR